MPTKSKTVKDKKAAKAERLSPIQLKAMNLMLSGMELEEISKVVGRGRQTLSQWKNQDPLFKGKYEELLDEAEDWLRATMPANDAYMMGRLRKIADGSGETALKAIQWYFDRFDRVDVKPNIDRRHPLLEPFSGQQGDTLTRILGNLSQSRKP